MELWDSFFAGESVKCYSSCLGNRFGHFLQILNIYLLYDLAILFLGIYSSEIKRHANKKTCNCQKVEATDVYQVVNG